MQIVKGMIVKSNMGHDKDRYYLVIREENGFAVIADGKRRTLEKPKRKNFRHLGETSQIVDPAQYDTDRKVRALLWKLNYPDQADCNQR